MFLMPLNVSRERTSMHVPLGGGPGKGKDKLEGLCLLADPGICWALLRGASEVSGEEEVWVSAAPTTQSPISR